MMFFTARVPHVAEPNAGGSIGFATSPDLVHWTIQPPVYRGGTFGQMEVPQVFERNGRWYCLFCTSGHQYSAAMRAAYPGAPVTGTHYLIGESPRGPWRVAPGAFLDGSLPCKRYAARIVEHEGALFIIGFLHDSPDGSFIGVVSDPDPVEVGADGLLHVIIAN